MSDTCSTCDSDKGNEEHKENVQAAFALKRADCDHANAISQVILCTDSCAGRNKKCLMLLPVPYTYGHSETY